MTNFCEQQPTTPDSFVLPEPSAALRRMPIPGLDESDSGKPIGVQRQGKPVRSLAEVLTSMEVMVRSREQEASPTATGQQEGAKALMTSSPERGLMHPKNTQSLDELLMLEGVNWIGKEWSDGKPVPELPKPLRDEAERQCRKLQECMTGKADAKEIAVMLHRLQGHYWQAGMSDTLAREVADDYVRLLDGYHVALWRKATDRILLDGTRKFFPKLSEMKEELDKVKALAKWRLTKLTALLNTRPQTA